MTELQWWMVHPRSGLAHYTRLLFDPAISRITICKLKLDDSWKPMEGHESKCKNCMKSLKRELREDYLKYSRPSVSEV